MLFYNLTVIQYVKSVIVANSIRDYWIALFDSLP